MKKLLVFDLDDTLILGSEMTARRNELQVGKFGIKIRPFWGDLRKALTPQHDFAIWSVGSAGYVDGVCEFLFTSDCLPVFKWHREYCDFTVMGSPARYQFRKSLTKLEPMLETYKSIVVVDDSPIESINDRIISIKIQSWDGDVLDSELAKLMTQLLNQS